MGVRLEVFQVNGFVLGICPMGLKGQKLLGWARSRNRPLCMIVHVPGVELRIARIEEYQIKAWLTRDCLI